MEEVIGSIPIRSTNLPSQLNSSLEASGRCCLPEYLRQGLLHSRGHPIVLRFSSNPGDMLADNVSSPRRLALKLLGVDEEKMPNHAGKPTHDLVCINANAFTAPDPAGFLKRIKPFDKNASAHGTHRPLGGIMRSQLKADDAMSHPGFV